MLFNISCSDDNSYISCSNITGICECICDNGFITVNSDTLCNYEQLYNSVNILFSLLFGLLGTNWFYLARGNRLYMLIGFTKFMCSFIGLSLYIMLLRISQTINHSIYGNPSYHFCWYDVVVSIATFCMCFVVPLWYVTDFVCAILWIYPDGNGQELY